MKKLLLVVMTVALILLAILHLFPQVETNLHQLLGWN